MPPLMRATENGRLAEVRRLLQNGADVNDKVKGVGITALMLAAGRIDERARIQLCAVVTSPL